MKFRLFLAASLLFNVTVIGAGVFVGCSSTQKTDAKVITTCTLADADKIAAILEDKTTTGEQKLQKLAADVEPDVAACVLKARALAPAPAAAISIDAGSGSGSAK